MFFAEAEAHCLASRFSSGCKQCINFISTCSLFTAFSDDRKKKSMRGSYCQSESFWFSSRTAHEHQPNNNENIKQITTGSTQMCGYRFPSSPLPEFDNYPGKKSRGLLRLFVCLFFWRSEKAFFLLSKKSVESRRRTRTIPRSPKIAPARCHGHRNGFIRHADDLDENGNAARIFVNGWNPFGRDDEWCISWNKNNKTTTNQSSIQANAALTVSNCAVAKVFRLDKQDAVSLLRSIELWLFVLDRGDEFNIKNIVFCIIFRRLVFDSSGSIVLKARKFHRAGRKLTHHYATPSAGEDRELWRKVDGVRSSLSLILV